jgi:hypothetical protein
VEPEQYKKNLATIIATLKRDAPTAKLIWCI